MTVLDSNVVGVILPSIARDLHAGFAQVEWVVSAYVLCFASMLLPAGVIADRFGRKHVLICGLVLFALASWALRGRSAVRCFCTARVPFRGSALPSCLRHRSRRSATVFAIRQSAPMPGRSGAGSWG